MGFERILDSPKKVAGNVNPGIVKNIFTFDSPHKKKNFSYQFSGKLSIEPLNNWNSLLNDPEIFLESFTLISY